MPLAAVLLLAILGAGIFLRASFSELAGRSPMNIEAAFALAWLTFLFFKLRDSSDAGSRELSRRDYFGIGLVVVAALAMFGWTGHFYFVADDFVLLGHAQGPWRFRTMGSDGFLRPAGYLFNTLSWRWVHASSTEWHWMGFSIHAVNCVLVYCLAAALHCSATARMMAAGLFALHGTRPEVALWIAGRFDLLSTLCVLLGLILLVHRRRTALFPLVLALMVVGLLTKESAFAFPFLAALTLRMSGERLAKHKWRLASIFVVAGVVFLYRWNLYGGIGGYATDSISALSLLKALALRLWSVLFFPIDWASAIGWFLAAALTGYIAGLIALFASTSASRRRCLEAVGFTLLAALPVVSRLLIGADMEGSRVMYLPSVGFCLLMGLLVANAPRGVLIGAAILLFQGAALWHNLKIWDFTTQRVHDACITAARCPTRVLVGGLPRAIEGVNAFGNGFPECVAMQTADAPEVDLKARDGAVYSCVFSWDPQTMDLRH